MLRNLTPVGNEQKNYRYLFLPQIEIKMPNIYTKFYFSCKVCRIILNSLYRKLQILTSNCIQHALLESKIPPVPIYTHIWPRAIEIC